MTIENNDRVVKKVIGRNRQQSIYSFNLPGGKKITKKEMADLHNLKSECRFFFWFSGP